MSDQTEREPATEAADTYQRHGEPDPSKWEKAEAVTDRPNDTPLRGEDKPAVPNTTLADRAKAAKKATATKAVADADAENKAVASATTKRSRSSKK